MGIIDQEEIAWRRKRHEVLRKFTTDFEKLLVDGDASTHAVYEILVRGENPYNVIEMLLKHNKSLIDRFTFLSKVSTQEGMRLLTEEINNGRL